MLERFEEISPNALSIFIKKAETQGVYRSLRESQDYRKLAQSTLSKSIDLGFKLDRTLLNRSTVVRGTKDDEPQMPPPRYTKLVTFKSSPKARKSEKSSPRNSILGAIRRSNQDSFSIAEIKDL